MMEFSSNRDYDEVLVVDSNHTRGHAFLAVLDFIKVDAKLVSPQQLGEIPRREMYSYLAIFSIGGEDLTEFFLNRNREDECQYPVVLMVDRSELREHEIIVRLPYISGLCFQSDYYSLAQVLDQARKHNKRERRMQNRECQQLIGSSEAIDRINLLIDQVAETSASVLIVGDSGTGKEIIARNVHAQSSRSKMPFIPVNCGAIPADMLEGELFGAEDQADADSVPRRLGRFELAEGGILFLDEIDEMPPSTQVRLLRVLQEGSYEKVGGDTPIATDVRVIAAAQQRLEELVATGKFREDLFYRLNVFPIEVPPLRERTADVPLLIHEMIARIEREHRGSVRLSKNAVATLQAYAWPGNVRELVSLIERLAILFPQGVVDTADLPERYRGAEPVVARAPDDASSVVASLTTSRDQLLPSEGIDMKRYLTDIEISLIEQALLKTNNVVARAANMLNMRRTTLVEKMRKYEIQRAD